MNKALKLLALVVIFPSLIFSCKKSNHADSMSVKSLVFRNCISESWMSQITDEQLSLFPDIFESEMMFFEEGMGEEGLSYEQLELGKYSTYLFGLSINSIIRDSDYAYKEDIDVIKELHTKNYNAMLEYIVCDDYYADCDKGDTLFSNINDYIYHESYEDYAYAYAQAYEAVQKCIQKKELALLNQDYIFNKFFKEFEKISDKSIKLQKCKYDKEFSDEFNNVYNATYELLGAEDTFYVWVKIIEPKNNADGNYELYFINSSNSLKDLYK